MSDLPRLYVEHPLREGAVVPADPGQSHYLLNVMRRTSGDRVALFNGRDGEWSAVIGARGRREIVFAAETQRRAQDAALCVSLAFAPIRSHRLETLIEKATELGVAALFPIITRRTIAGRVNVARLRATAIEAAEQCDRLTVPKVDDAVPLDGLIAGWQAAPPGRIFLLDESSARTAKVATLAAALKTGDSLPALIVVGPEGGFETSERDALSALTAVTPVTLGPRILRAETAAMAALACWQVFCGDMR